MRESEWAHGTEHSRARAATVIMFIFIMAVAVGVGAQVAHAFGVRFAFSGLP